MQSVFGRRVLYTDGAMQLHIGAQRLRGPRVLDEGNVLSPCVKVKSRSSERRREERLCGGEGLCLCEGRARRYGRAALKSPLPVDRSVAPPPVGASSDVVHQGRWYEVEASALPEIAPPQKTKTNTNKMGLSLGVPEPQRSEGRNHGLSLWFP